MPSWILILLYLFIGGMIAMSFEYKEAEPDYGFVTVIMLFWPIVVLVFFIITIVILMHMFRGE